MTRILIIETASPKRVCRKAEQVVSAGVYPDPDITILCATNNSREYMNLPGIEVYPITVHTRRHVLKELNRNRFDVILAFWTGEKQYRWMKRFVFRLKAKAIYIDGGDGNEFRLTWKAVCRHTLLRWQHPLPSDRRDFIQHRADDEMDYHHSVQLQEDYDGEKILILQTAEPSYLLKALDRLETRPLFRNPRYVIFCRNRPEVVRSFQDHPMLYRVLTHSETRGSWKHFWSLRRERFDAIVVFLTGDPGYWKIKLFAFLLGARHKLIFNEAIDCFFFTFHQWLALISRRMGERPRPEKAFKCGYSTRILLSLLLKMVILPFRFLWLLLVWLRLRFAGWRSSR